LPATVQPLLPSFFSCTASSPVLRRDVRHLPGFLDLRINPAVLARSFMPFSGRVSRLLDQPRDYDFFAPVISCNLPVAIRLAPYDSWSRHARGGGLAVLSRAFCSAVCCSRGLRLPRFKFPPRFFRFVLTGRTLMRESGSFAHALFSLAIP